MAQPRRPALHYALAGVMWTYVWRIHDLLPVLRTIKLPLIFGVAAIGLFATASGTARAVRALKSPILYMLLALFGIMVLGVPTSLWPGRSLAFIAQDFMPNLLFAVMIASSIRDIRDVEWFSLHNLAGACVHGLFIYFKADLDSTGRFYGLAYYDANDFALVTVCTIGVAVYYLRPTVGWLLRLLALGSLVVFVLALMKSGSRGGFLALLAVMTYVLIKVSGIPARVRVAAVAGGLGALVIIGGTAYLDRMRTILHPKQDYNYTEAGGRYQIWKRGLGYMATHPLLGVGVRTFPMAEGTLSAVARERASQGRGFRWMVAHNSFIEIGAEMGVFALALFIAILRASFKRLARAMALARARLAVAPTDDDAARMLALAQMLTAALIGFVIAGFFVSAWFFSYLYLTFGLIMGYMRLIGSAPVPPAPTLARVGGGAHARVPLYPTRVPRR